MIDETKLIIQFFKIQLAVLLVTFDLRSSHFLIFNFCRNQF